MRSVIFEVNQEQVLLYEAMFRKEILTRLKLSDIALDMGIEESAALSIEIRKNIHAVTGTGGASAELPHGDL